MRQQQPNIPLGLNRAQIDKHYRQRHCLQFNRSAWLRRGAGRSDAYWRFSESQHTEPANQFQPIAYF